jgi:hypothetical protein
MNSFRELANETEALSVRLRFLRTRWDRQNATRPFDLVSNHERHAESLMRQDDQNAVDGASILAGDVAALEGIVRPWQQKLVSVAWRFCRDRALSKDMAQEVFLKAFRSLASYRREAAFSTWLTAIALKTYRSRSHPCAAIKILIGHERVCHQARSRREPEHRGYADPQFVRTRPPSRGTAG